MASSGRNRGANHGYRSWFPPYRYNQQVDQPIFILDYEAKSKKDETFEPSFDSEDDYQSGGNTRTINGVQVYFLDEGHNKRSAFLRHAPYFYLLIRSELTSNQINRIIAQIQELGEKKVIMVSKEICHDAADLTFLITKDFLKVTVDHPRSVPSIRSQCEQIKGVIEWREADVLYNHRVAIDHNIRVGSWYQADIRGGEIHKLDILHNKAPPELQILAYDIETVFDLTREPNPNRDAISMISLFTGNVNHLIINDDVVDTKDVSGIDIVLKQKDKDHSKPWVDWCKKDTFFPQSVLIERVPVNVQIYKNEQQLLHRFYEIIEEYQPDVFADFFGDRFDIPFLAVRSLLYNISLERRTGFRIKYKRRPDGQNQGNIDLRENYSPASIDSVSGAGIIHLDAYLFNEKYSYLPKKDLGLKPSVEKKLKIIPIGREALFAIEESPVDAVGYAACDGYITYRYVKEIVLDFFISLGQMFPVPSSEILTRRAGSLDDLLIDAEGHHYNIIGKRRIEQKHIESFSPNIRIDSFAYTGGLVEARRSGIFRSDIFTDFKPNKKALTEIKALIQQIITKNSEGIAKREMKNQFDRKILAKFGDLPISFTDDLEQLHKNFSSALQQNGVPTSLYEEKNSILREILEDLSDIQVEGVEQVVEEIVKQIDELLDTSGPVQMRGVHVDVTSMYPSQIRQYKLQPSGIVPLTKCQKCNYKEKDGSCFFEGDWVIKLTARRPCKHKVKSSSKCDPSICTTQNESTCKEYEPEEATTGRIQEIFSYNGSQTEAHILKKRSGFTKIPLSKSYLGKNFTSVDPYNRIEKWLEQTVEATQLGTHLDRNHFDIFEDQPKSFQLPKNTYLSIDVRTKKISVLISVQSRVCQKAFNFVARIMDEFFNTRVRHKFEAQRLKQVIKQKNLTNQSVPPTTLRQQKFHDSTQLGMKVPLNSIYGLLGMRGGVRNASTPCAGITTKLSADLIYWAANQLENIGMVTELDSLDYAERLVLKDPDGFIKIDSIGEFTDYCLSISESGVQVQSRGVEYVSVPSGWKALSVSEYGVVEWKTVLRCVRQKTNRNIFKITTPFGSVKTTDSHSIFHQIEERIEPLIVNKLNDEFIAHIGTIPNIQKSGLYVDFTSCSPESLELFVYVPVGGEKKWGGRQSSLRYDKKDKNKRRNYYEISLKRFNGKIEPGTLVGSRKGYKYSPIIKLDGKIAELCGWFVAEGSSGIYNGIASVGISQKNKINLKRIEELIVEVAKHLHTTYKVTPALSDSRSQTFRLAMDNIFFYHLFETLGCGHTAFNKRIPKLILSANTEIKDAFLRGYFAGDGSIQGKRKAFYTSSSGLRDDLYVLGKQLGSTVSIQETVSATSGNPCYVINFMNYENWRVGSGLHYPHRELNDTINIQKKSLEEVEKTSEYVYDLTVDENNNFVSANGGIICHNTDGVWLWVPKQFPLDFPVTLSNPAELDEKLEFRVSLIDKILNEKVITAGFKNDNYQLNDGVTIKRTSKSLIQFEQDGPYDFQFVMGKKKYIVYNHLGQDNKWEEEEITGLESKRADFSKLQKHFQEEIIKAYLEQYDPANPISLGQIYQNAFKASDRIRNEVLEGNLDPSYFVKPKAINKDLKDYKSKLPQVTAAYILKDLGYSIDPGIRIQMVNIKGNHVIPAQVFDFDFEKVKSVFIKHGICTLSFMLNEITSISDIKQLIDTKQYLKDIYDPGRIFDRMIQYPMKTQEVKSDTQIILDIEEIENAEKEKILEQESEDVNTAIIIPSEPEEETPPLRLVKLSTNVNLKKTQKKRGKPRTQSLDTIFNFPQTTKSQPKRRRKKGGKRSSSSVKPSSMKSVSPQISRNEIESIIPKSVETTSRDQKSSLVSPDEIDELEKTDLYTNGEKGEEETSITQEESTSDEEIVCSKCGAFITLTEFNEEGCVYCHDPTLTE